MRFTGRVRSFTLIELLIVISIIITLMGLLLAAISTVPDMVKRGEAKAKIKQLCTAIDEYKNKYGNYPPDGTGVSGGQIDDGNGYMLEHLDGDGYLPYPDVNALQRGYKFIEVKPDMLGARATFAKRPQLNDWQPEEQPELLDPWNRPYQYVRNVDDNGDPILNFTKRGAFQQYPDPREDHGIIKPQNKNSYDIWSFGKNPNDMDDAINNWRD